MLEPEVRDSRPTWQPLGQKEPGVSKKLGQGSSGEGTAMAGGTRRAAPGCSRGVREWLWFCRPPARRQRRTDGAMKKKTEAQGEKP